MYPIVLAHGIARFDILLAAAGRNAYFKYIPDHLRKKGRFEVYETSVPFTESVIERSKKLKTEVAGVLAKSGAKKVHIIGHSMGGLDARHAIVDLGMASSVASLTTIGTPHCGTSFADEGLHGLGGVGDRLVGLLGGSDGDLAGFRDLSTAACLAFNERAEPAEASNAVRYITYSSFQSRSGVFAPLQLSWDIIQREQGPSDGLVPVSSQQWVKELTGVHGIEKKVTQRRFRFEADHLNQVGWWDPNELASGQWWNPVALVKKLATRRLESQVRDLYLQIAREATARTSQP